MRTRRRPPFSLRRRLLLGAVLGLGLLGALATLATIDYGRRTANLAYDRLLASAALQMSGAISVQEREIQVDLPQAAFETLALAREDRVFYRVSGPRDQVLTGYPDLPWEGKEDRLASAILPDWRDASRFFTAEYSGEPVRFIELRRSLVEPELQGTIRVQLGHTFRARDALAWELIQRPLALVGLVALLTLILLGLGVDLALRPLARMERELAGRSEVDLSPLHAPAPQEVARLQSAINLMMARLSDTLERIQRYTEDAAHQIRTPLATLKALAQNLQADGEAALDERRRRHLAQMLRSVDQVNATLAQLLNQAVMAHRLQSEPRVAVNLSKVLRQVCLEYAMPALRRDVELALEGAEGECRVQGNEYALTQLFRNLVENAVRHTRPHTQVEVEVGRRDGQCWVEVRDQGSGIPPEERGKVFERFYRGSGRTGAGSGLGLAIVREVARAHGAGIELNNRETGGLCVRVSFPETGPGEGVS